MSKTTMTRRLRVSTDGTSGPYIIVPVAQVDQVKAILSKHGIPFWVAENAISFDGAPEITVVNLGRLGDAQAVQAILDRAA